MAPHPLQDLLAVPGELPLAVLPGLAAADDPDDVAGVVLDALRQLEGVRSTAVVRRDRGRAVVLASVGYDCDTLAAGSVLPLDSGLPVTEALRTGRPVVQGRGPSWVALPLPGRGRTEAALLLSLHRAPPSQDGLGVLLRLADVLAPALARAER